MSAKSWAATCWLSIMGTSQLWRRDSLSNKADEKTTQNIRAYELDFKLIFIFRSGENNYFSLHLLSSVMLSYKIKNTYNFLLLSFWFLLPSPMSLSLYLFI